MFSSWQSHFLTSAHMVHTLLFIFKPTRNSKNFENLLRGHLSIILFVYFLSLCLKINVAFQFLYALSFVIWFPINVSSL